MKSCSFCGAQNPDDSNICANCQKHLDQQNSLNPVPVVVEPAPTPAPAPEAATPVVAKKKKSKLAFILIPIILILLLGGVFAALVLTKVICLQHDWSAATCTTASFCYNCDKVNGTALGHQFEDATCLKAKTCKVCGATEGKALGHTEGEWTVTKEPTLVATGTDVQHCAVCDEEIDERTVAKTSPTVVKDAFNFKDEEYITWLNDVFYIYEFSTINLGTAAESIYSVESTAGAYGFMLLQHNEDGYVNTVTFAFSNEADAYVTCIMVAEKMNSEFEATEVLDSLLAQQYYINGDMMVLASTMDGYYAAAITPYEHFLDYLAD